MNNRINVHVQVVDSTYVYSVKSSVWLELGHGPSSARTLRHSDQRDSAHLPREPQDRRAMESRDNLSAEKRVSFAGWRPRMPRFRMGRLDRAQGYFVLPRRMGNQNKRRVGRSFDAPTNCGLPIADSQGPIHSRAAPTDRVPRLGVRETSLICYSATSQGGRS